MGIYIKGMEMPGGCMFCPAHNTWRGLCQVLEKTADFEKRRSDCPLVPVPPHGRLIDADALREDWLENGENEYVYDTNAFLGSLDGAPTIIPASGGTEDE